MIITITGSNTYMASSLLHEYIDDYVATYGDIGLERIHTEGKTYSQLLDSVQAMPFLSPKRLVIINSPSSNKELNEKITQFIRAINNHTDVLFVEAKFDKRSSLYKVLKKETDFKECNELDENALAKWIGQFVAAEGGTISFSDARYLVHRVGLNQQRLSNEIAKLLNYQLLISKVTIDLLTEQTPSSTIFDLLDSALRGDQEKALIIYAQQRKQKVEPQAILALLAWQLHILAIVKYAGTKAPDVIAKQAKLSPYVVRKSLSLAKELTQSDIKKLIERTYNLDVQLKSLSVDADEALQDLLVSCA